MADATISTKDLHPRYNPVDRPQLDRLIALAERVNRDSKALRLHVGPMQPDPHTPAGVVHHYDCNENVLFVEPWDVMFRTLHRWFGIE